MTTTQHSLDAPTLQHIADRLAADNQNIAANGIIEASTGEKVLTGYSYHEVYDWDGYFENLYLSHYGIADFCRNNVAVFLDRQTPSGFIERTLGHRYPKPRQHIKPFLAQTLVLAARQGADLGWLAGDYFERLLLSIDYWFRHCDPDKNGLASWNSADHSGMDNQVSRSGELDSMRVEGADLNSYLVRELRAAALLASLLDERLIVSELEARADQLANTINELLWCEETAFYHDRDDLTGRHRGVYSVAGLLPLWAGIVPPDRAERLINEHLLNPDEFWLPHGVATYARSEPDYYQMATGNECSWRGAVWIPTNYMVFHGLRTAGHYSAARQLASRSLQLALGEPTTREYYDGETGAGQGLDPFWGWSTLAYTMVLEANADYDPTQLSFNGHRSLITDALPTDVIGAPTEPRLKGNRTT